MSSSTSRPASPTTITPGMFLSDVKADRTGGAGGRAARLGGVGPPRPVRRPKGCDSGKWVSEPSRAARPPVTGPVRLALRSLRNSPGGAAGRRTQAPGGRADVR